MQNVQIGPEERTIQFLKPGDETVIYRIDKIVVFPLEARKILRLPRIITVGQLSPEWLRDALSEIGASKVAPYSVEVMEPVGTAVDIGDLSQKCLIRSIALNLSEKPASFGVLGASASLLEKLPPFNQWSEPSKINRKLYVL